MYKYLCFPVVATGVNLILAFLFSNYASKASATSLMHAQHERGIIGKDDKDVEYNDYCMAPSIVPHNISVGGPVAAANDPYLRQMPNMNFKAYVRPDVSTFYREEPGSRQPSPHNFNGQAGKFINMSPDRLGLYW